MGKEIIWDKGNVSFLVLKAVTVQMEGAHSADPVEDAK